MLPHEDNILNSECGIEGRFWWENRTSCLFGLKTHPTIVPRVGVQTHDLPHSIASTWPRCPTPFNHSARETYVEYTWGRRVRGGAGGGGGRQGWGGGARGGVGAVQTDEFTVRASVTLGAGAVVEVDATLRTDPLVLARLAETFVHLYKRQSEETGRSAYYSDGNKYTANGNTTTNEKLARW